MEKSILHTHLYHQQYTYEGIAEVKVNDKDWTEIAFRLIETVDDCSEKDEYEIELTDCPDNFKMDDSELEDLKKLVIDHIQ